MTSAPLIIALGAGLEHKAKQDPPFAWIGKETELRAVEAARLWQRNPLSIVMFSGGRPAGPGTPSEAEAMQDCVQRLPWNIPAENILTENDSIDTASNIRNVAVIIAQRELPTANVMLVAGGNLMRAAAYCRAYGMQVAPVMVGTLSMARFFHEFLLRLEQLVDRRGRFVMFLKRWQLRRQSSAPSPSGYSS